MDIAVSIEVLKYLEPLAVGLGILYVILAIKQNSLAWPCAFLSTIIFSIIFWEGSLPMQTVLNVFYMIMALYGWLTWRSIKNIKVANSIKLWHHGLLVIFGVALSLLISFYLEIFLDSLYPKLDAMVAVFSFIATFMVIKKIIDGWLYWILINTITCYLFFITEFYFVAAKFILYILLAMYGYYYWYKHYRERIMLT